MAVDNELQVRLLHAVKTHDNWKKNASGNPYYPKRGEVCLESVTDGTGLKYKIKIGDANRPFAIYTGSDTEHKPLSPDGDWDFTSSSVLPYFGTVVTASGTPQVLSLYKYPDDYSTVGLRGKTVARIYQLTLSATESAGETTIALGINQNSYKEIRPGNNITFTGNETTVPSSTILEISASMDFNSLDVGDIALAEIHKADPEDPSDADAIRVYKINEVNGKIYKSSNFVDIKVSSPLTLNATTGIGIQDGTTSQKGAIQLLDTYTTGTSGNAEDNTKATTNKAITAAISNLDGQATTLDDTTSSLDIINTVTETNGIVSSTKKTLLAGNKINLVVPTGEDTNAGKIIINHDTVASPTVTQGTQDIPSSYTEGEKETLVITDVTTDGYGHITSYKSEASTNLIAADIKAPVTKPDDTTWNHRETGGDITIGEDTARIPSLKGNTMVWNQLVANNKITTTYSTPSQTSYPIICSIDSVANNRYIVIVTSSRVRTSPSTDFNVFIEGTLFIGDITGTKTHSSVIVSPTSSGTLSLRVALYTGLSSNVTITSNFIDLTKMFGAGNEPTTVEEFEKLFPNSYYPYCEGRLVNLGGYGVKWNQMVQNGASPITGTFNSSGQVNIMTQLIAWHAYYIQADVLTSDRVNISIWGMGPSNRSTGSNNYETLKTVAKYSNDITSTARPTAFINLGTVDNTITRKNVMVIDLTAMFGPGSEPTLEEFEAMFTKDYYEYDAGTEMNIFDAIGDKKLGLESTGFNQWDEEWEVYGYNDVTGEPYDKQRVSSERNHPISVLPKTNYYFNIIPINILWYDRLDNFIRFDYLSQTDGHIVQSPDNAAYLRFYMSSGYGTTYNHDICINISSSRNGEYEPYKKDTLDLDWIREIEYTPSGSSTPEKLFPYGLLSAGSVHDEVTETKAIKRVGVVDLGTLSWVQYGYAQHVWTISAGLSNRKPYGDGICKEGYKFRTTGIDPANLNNKEAVFNNYWTANGMSIRDDSYETYSDFETAMSGVLLYYELATPIEIPLAEPHQMSYVVDDHGTEQQLPINVSSVINAPFVGTFEYYSNFKDAIRDAIRDLFDKINNQKNPVKGIDDTPQTNGKLAVYDSDYTVKSSNYSVLPSGNPFEGSTTGILLPTAAQIIDYVNEQLTSSLTYKGVVSGLAGSTSGKIYFSSLYYNNEGVVTKTVSGGDLYFLGNLDNSASYMTVTSEDATHYKIASGNYYPGTMFIWNESDESNEHWDAIASNTSVSNNDPYLWVNTPIEPSEGESPWDGKKYQIGSIEGNPLTVRVPELPDIAGKQTSGNVLVGNGTGASDTKASWRGLKLDETVNNDTNNTQIGGTNTGLLERYNNGSLDSPSYQWRFADTYALDLVKATNSDASSGKVIVGNYDSTASTHTDKPSWRNLKLDELSYDGTGLVPALGTGFLKRTGTDSWSLTNDTLTWKDETNSPTYTEVTQSTTDKGLTNFIHSYSGVTTIELGSYGTSPNVTKDGFRINIPLLTSNNATVGKVLKGTKTTGVTTLPTWDNLSLEELSEVLDSAGASGYLKRVDNGESATDRYTWEFDPYGGGSVMPYKSNSAGTGDVATSSKTTAEINLLPTAGEKVLARTALREQVGTNSYVYHKISVGALENDSNIVLVLNGNFS